MTDVWISAQTLLRAMPITHERGYYTRMRREKVQLMIACRILPFFSFSPLKIPISKSGNKTAETELTENY